MGHLLEFYGDECPHCHTMKPLIEQLASEEGLLFEQFEVWHNEENAAKMQEWVSKSACLGVPMFVNTNSGDVLCGATDYDSLKEFAKK